MANVKRIYVEKKEDYAVAAKELKQEVKEYLGIKDLEQIQRRTPPRDSFPPGRQRHATS